MVFWGADQGQVTIRDNSGVTGAGLTGTVANHGNGGLDLTITEQLARSMSIDDAMNADNLLCYEMNGAPLPPDHGAPVRLIAQTGTAWPTSNGSPGSRSSTAASKDGSWPATTSASARSNAARRRSGRSPTAGEHAIRSSVRQRRQHPAHTPGPLPHQPKNVLGEQRTDHSSRANHLKEAVCMDGSDRSICGWLARGQWRVGR